MNVSEPIAPDTKDWTWVLRNRCPECGYDATAVAVDVLPDRIRHNTAGWTEVLTRRDVGVRPSRTTWSPLEYACHVRDVHRIFDERVRLMLETDDPRFANWDQDATAIAENYAAQDPATVLADLADGSEALASRFAGVGGDQWSRTGRRSDGSVFTVDSLGTYYLHDIEHHLHDVTGSRDA